MSSAHKRIKLDEASTAKPASPAKPVSYRVLDPRRYALLYDVLSSFPSELVRMVEGYVDGLCENAVLPCESVGFEDSTLATVTDFTVGDKCVYVCWRYHRFGSLSMERYSYELGLGEVKQRNDYTANFGAGRTVSVLAEDTSPSVNAVFVIVADYSARVLIAVDRQTGKEITRSSPFTISSAPYITYVGCGYVLGSVFDRTYTLGVPPGFGQYLDHHRWFAGLRDIENKLEVAAFVPVTSTRKFAPALHAVTRRRVLYFEPDDSSAEDKEPNGKVRAFACNPYVFVKPTNGEPAGVLVKRKVALDHVINAHNGHDTLVVAHPSGVSPKHVLLQECLWRQRRENCLNTPRFSELYLLDCTHKGRSSVVWQWSSSTLIDAGHRSELDLPDVGEEKHCRFMQLGSRGLFIVDGHTSFFCPTDSPAEEKGKPPQILPHVQQQLDLYQGEDCFRIPEAGSVCNGFLLLAHRDKEKFRVSIIAFE